MGTSMLFQWLRICLALSTRPPRRRHHGHEQCAAHQACQGHQGVQQDRFSGTVHAGARRIHGRHEQLHYLKRERLRSRGWCAHPARVRVRGSEAALNLWLGAGCLGWRLGPPGWSAVNKVFVSYVIKCLYRMLYRMYEKKKERKGSVLQWRGHRFNPWLGN